MKAKSQSFRNPILEGRIWEQMILFCLPLIFGNFFQQLYNTIDAVVVGRFVGTEALSEVGGSSAVIINVFVQFFIGISAGAAVVVAQNYGAMRKERLRDSVYTAMLLSVALGVFLCFFGILFSRQMALLLHTPEDVLPGTVSYLKIYFCGMIPNLVYNMGAGILRAVGDSKRPLYFLMLSCILNILLDLLFVLGFHMGVEGVAVATVLCQLTAAVMVVWILFRSKEEYRLTLRDMRFRKDALKKILYMGLPGGMQSMMYTMSNVLVQFMVNSFGTKTMAAWTAYGKIDALFWMICASFGIACTTFVGQNYGASNFPRVRESVRQCFLIMAPLAILASVLFHFFGSRMFVLFTRDGEVIQIGAEILHVLSPFFVFYTLIEILSGALRGMGDAIPPMLIDLLGVCVFRVSWVLLVLPHFRSLFTLMLCFPLAWLLTGFLFLGYFPWYMKRYHIL